MLLALYTCFLLVLGALGVHAGVLGRVARRAKAPMRPAPLPEDALPAVTVQLPLYNEVHVAGRLLDAVAALDYPRDRLDVQVLDDSDDDTTALVAERVARLRGQGLRIAHVRRDTREGFKAGALAEGLRLAEGEIIAIFDADFVPRPDVLRRLVLPFANPSIGCVQARWGHLNAAYSPVTQAQAFGLDLHFAVEHRARVALGGFFNFNGTAGLWRRACIEDAGGWSARTLAEDLDLSLRAQLRGWRFTYDAETVVPAELPAEIAAWRTQQARWARGGIGTARLLLGPLWRSHVALRTKLLTTVHLLSPLAHPATLGLALLHAPVTLDAPIPALPALVGALGFAGYALAAVVTRRGAGARGLWPGPLFLAGMVGLSPGLAAATVAGALGRPAPFARTAKFDAAGTDPGAAARSRYRTRRPGVAGWAEVLLALYALGGLAALLRAERWDALPFQGLVVAGTLLVAVTGLTQRHAWGSFRRRTLSVPRIRRPAWNASKMP
ncbi:MAG TPA: glycosyltransferase [Rhodothermales bacterium]|nr:glycosyltransferase [Rhodothermales bacterium]